MTGNSIDKGPFPTSKHKVIAVIDDDDLVTEAMEGLLQAWGYQVLTAKFSMAAIANRGDGDCRPDLIISDYREPNRQKSNEINDHVHRWLRAPIPVLIVSGDGAPEHLRDLCTSGHRLLYKPVDPATLRIVIEQVLSESAPPRSTPDRTGLPLLKVAGAGASVA